MLTPVTGERVHEVGALYSGQVFVAQLLYIVAKRLLRALDTQSGNDYFIESLLVLSHVDGHTCTCGSHFLVGIAQIGYYQGTSGGNFERELTVDVSDYCGFCSFYRYGCTNDRFAIFIEYLSSDCLLISLLHLVEGSFLTGRSYYKCRNSTKAQCR